MRVMQNRRLGALLAAAIGLHVVAAFGATAAYDSGGTGTAARRVADAQRAAHHGRYTEALADIDKALTLAPSFGSAYSAQARILMDMGRYDDAATALNHVIAMHPDDMDLGMQRVKLALRRADGNTALVALKAALSLPLRSFWHDPYEAGTYEPGSGTHVGVTGHMESYADEYSSIAEQILHQDEASLQDMARMLKLEAVHPEYILASYCYDAALAGLLESAELTCEQSITENAHDIGQYDSLGFVHLRMKQWDKAIADYDKALDRRSDLTLSLYGRGLAKRAKGDSAGGNADIAAATRDEPDIANIMKRLGVTAS